MKNIFLIAKYYAHKEDSDKITLKHFEKALSNVKILDLKAKEEIKKFLQLDQNIIIEPADEDFTKVALKLDRINYDDDLKKLKNVMEKKGFLLSEKISEVIIKKPTLAIHLKKIENLKNALLEKVYGQDSAIEAIIDKLTETLYLEKTDTPKAIFFFLGPTATGKTYLTDILAENLDDYHSKLFDMTQMQGEDHGSPIFGIAAPMSGQREGDLTKAIKKNKNVIAVFDELEKANSKLMQQFLLVLSRGYYFDNYSGEKIDARDTIFIFTSNLGKELYNNTSFDKKLKENPELAESMLLDVISREMKTINGREEKALSPELLSRLSQGSSILFKKLPFNAHLTIAQNRISSVVTSFEQTMEIDLEIENFKELSSLLTLSFLPNIDPRKVKSKIHLKILDPITDFLRENSEVEIKKAQITLNSNSKETLVSFLKNSDIEKALYLKDCFRKSKTFVYDYELTLKKNTINFEIKNIAIKRVEKAKDFDGDGGISIELPDVGFSDIAGHNKIKNRLSEIINLLKNPKKIERFDVDTPKGMLLYGVPGTGKTMLAKAFAKESDLSFIATTGSEILNINFMKDIFKRAKEYAPAIIFIDEIDAIGRRDGSNKDIVINHFLTELNGFKDSQEGLFVIAATNLKEKLDPAILRSGRIDIHIEVDRLDKKARGYFIDKILKRPVSSNIDRKKLINYSVDMTGADLEKVLRESSLYVVKHGLELLTQEIILEQINIIKYGEKIEHIDLSKAVEATAYHEAGHAVLSKILSPEIKIEQITITPRRDALGFVSYNSEDIYHNTTIQSIKNKICILMAGRVAQIKKYGTSKGLDSGASNDLEKATSYIEIAISKLGMSNEIGYINTDGLSRETKTLFNSEVKKEIQSWIKELEVKTTELINTYWDQVEKVALELIEKETLDEFELNQIIKDNQNGSRN